MEFCPHCMVRATGEYCTNCGRNINDVSQSAGALPIGYILESPVSSKKRYQLGAALGQGGFGITYAAIELDTGRRVAVKEYFPSRNRWAYRSKDGITVETPTQSENEYYCGRNSFVKEAQAMAAIGGRLHNIVEGLDYLETNNTAYLVMEFVDGNPLNKVIESNGKMTADELLPRIRPLMEDLDRLHKEYRILHRDICPDNIIVQPDGSFKLIDLGSARKMDPSSPMTLYVKPQFAPIEQAITGEQVGSWTDVYSLASTMYYCLTGIFPADAYERLKSMNNANIDSLVSPIDMGAVMTKSQEEVLLKAMAVKSQNRIRSIREFYDRLFGINPGKTIWTEIKFPAEDEGNRPNNDGQSKRRAFDLKNWISQKKNVVIIAATAAAVIVIAATVIIAVAVGGRKKDGRDVYSGSADVGVGAVSTKKVTPNSPNKPTEPSFSGNDLPSSEDVTTAPEESQPTRFKLDNITYEVRDGKAVVVGFSGSSSRGVLRIPSEANNYEVTGIAAGAFDNYCHLESVVFPESLTEIEDGAFNGCDNLRDLVVFSDIKANEPIVNCKKFRAIAGTYNVNGWNIPSGTMVYPYGMEIDLNTEYYIDYITGGEASLLLTEVYVTDDGCIYALTEDPDDDTTYSVLMDIPSGIDEVKVPEYIKDESYPTSWVYSEAFENADSDVTVYLSSQLIMSDNLYYEKSFGIIPDNFDETPISFIWAINRYIEYSVNKNRPSGQQFEMCSELFEPVYIRASEISENDSFKRPNGEGDVELVKEYINDWKYLYSSKGSNNLPDFLDNVISVNSKERENDGNTFYYDRFYAAAYIDPDTHTVYYYLISIC